MNYRTFGIAFILSLAVAAIAYAQSQSEVWNRVFDSATNSLRVVLS